MTKLDPNGPEWAAAAIKAALDVIIETHGIAEPEPGDHLDEKLVAVMGLGFYAALAFAVRHPEGVKPTYDRLSAMALPDGKSPMDLPRMVALVVADTLWPVDFEPEEVQ